MVSVQGGGNPGEAFDSSGPIGCPPAGIYLTRRPMAAKWQAPATTVQVCHTSW